MFAFFVLCTLFISFAHANINSQRILNGKPAALGEYPYTASIDCIGCGDGREYGVCGGAILDNRWILTDGFCVDLYAPMGKLSVRVGHINIMEGTQYNVSLNVTHPNYAEGYSLALLRTSDPIVFSPNVKPIEIDTVPLTFDEDVVLSSFGDETLQYINSLTISQDDCLNTFADLKPFECCTMSSPDVGACNYDEGSPVVRADKLVGIQSVRSNGCGLKYDIQMRMSDPLVIDWINSLTKKLD